MAAMTDYLEDIVLEMVLNSVTFAEPASTYIALFTAAPNDTAGSGTEVTGGAYARQQITADWTISGTATRAQNASVVTFPVATANWGTIGWVAIFDAVTTGNMLFHGALAATKIVNNSDQLEFPAGQLGVTLT